MSMTPKERAERVFEQHATPVVSEPDATVVWPTLRQLFVEAISEAEADARAAELERCCKAIRAECVWCNGEGNAITLGGRQLSECEYCGRPIAAIRKPPAESETVQPVHGFCDEVCQAEAYGTDDKGSQRCPAHGGPEHVEDE